MQSVLAALGNPRVDYLSLDVEGAEFPILKTLDLDTLDISCIGLEINQITNSSRKEVQNYLEDRNYSFEGTVIIDDFFVKKPS